VKKQKVKSKKQKTNSLIDWPCDKKNLVATVISVIGIKNLDTPTVTVY
jgi:hypothetical protein